LSLGRQPLATHVPKTFKPQGGMRFTECGHGLGTMCIAYPPGALPQAYVVPPLRG
jgi:hypothetical protein